MKKEFFSALLILSVLAIGCVDFITPYEYSMALLYLIPVIVTATRASLSSTVAMVVYVAVTWFLADYMTPSSPLQQYSLTALVWIGIIKMGTLLAVGLVVFKTTRTIRALDESKQQVHRLNQNLEQQVALRTAKLRDTVDELESFSHSLMHDMRAPLRAMRGYAELLMKEECAGCEKTLAKDYLRRIIAASSRMDALILDAFNYSKLAQGDVPLEPVDAGALVREIVQSYPHLQIHQSQIHVEGAFPLLMGNKAGLTQCVSNLLDNAVKFATPGTRPEVRVWAERRGEAVRLWFEDNGIGISTGWEKRIFQMFQQINKGYEGTGVGLAIVRKAAERMGGEVGVESELGKGSRFWLQLPAV